MVIKLPIGNFEFGIGDWGLGIREEDWRKINMGETPILYSKSTIGYFYHHLVIFTFSSLIAFVVKLIQRLAITQLLRLHTAN